MQVSRRSGEAYFPRRETLLALQIDVQVIQEEPSDRVRVEAAVELLGERGEVLGSCGGCSGRARGHLRRGEQSSISSVRNDPTATAVWPSTRRLSVPMTQAAPT